MKRNKAFRQTRPGWTAPDSGVDSARLISWSQPQVGVEVEGVGVYCRGLLLSYSLTLKVPMNPFSNRALS